MESLTIAALIGAVTLLLATIKHYERRIGHLEDGLQDVQMLTHVLRAQRDEAYDELASIRRHPAHRAQLRVVD